VTRVNETGGQSSSLELVMLIVHTHDAKAQLSRLVDRAVKGDPFVIAKAGTPLVKVTGLHVPRSQRLGFLAGEIFVPDDFDTMGHSGIEALYGSVP